MPWLPTAGQGSWPGSRAAWCQGGYPRGSSDWSESWCYPRSCQSSCRLPLRSAICALPKRQRAWGKSRKAWRFCVQVHPLLASWWHSRDPWWCCWWGLKINPGWWSSGCRRWLPPLLGWKEGLSWTWWLCHCKFLSRQGSGPLEGLLLLLCHHCHPRLKQLIRQSCQPAHAALGNRFPGLQSERETSAFPGQVGTGLANARCQVRLRSSNVSCQLIGCVIGCCRSMVMELFIASQCCGLRSNPVNVGLRNTIDTVMGWKSNGRSQGGHLSWSSPPLFTVAYYC